ncbi:hypothetical protein JXM67_06400 [candidate division WOR-3 bacterium]|nr:hypothetical protein [candidate division WOR-3 bacterium]
MTIAFLPLVLFTYELRLSDLKTPVIGNQFATEFSFQHRFYGSLADDPFGTFLGADAGANSYLGMGFYPLKGLGINVSRISYDNGIDLDLGYSFRFPKGYTRWRAGGELLSYKYSGDTARVWFPLAHLSVQTEPILGRIKPSLSVAYGGIFLFSGGISAVIAKDLWIFEEIALFAEYYPIPFGVTYLPEYPPRSTYVAGIGISTYGHQFLITISNDTDIGTRMLGGKTVYFEDDDTYIHLGFTIRRLLVRGKESE